MTRDGLGHLWALDPAITFLNHGSFGACPHAVLAMQDEWRRRLEAHPVRFMVDELEEALADAAARTCAFLRCAPDDFAFVPNATVGVNAVLRSLDLKPGDELLANNHEYNACLNALRYVAERAGARVVMVDIPCPVTGPEAVVEALLAHVTERTKLALVSHVTSPTALVFPIERIVRELAARGVDTLVDGAHGPGMMDLDVDGIGAAYYTGNFHKWTCAPKGAGFLHVRRDRRDAIRPAVISHGANSPREDRSRFRNEFDWTGTSDPTAFLCVPDAIAYVGGLHDQGWAGIRRDCRAQVLRGREMVCAALRERGAGVASGPDEMVGLTASFTLPDGEEREPPRDRTWTDPQQRRLYREHHIEVPVVAWPGLPRRMMRLSAHLYNGDGDYRVLARAVASLGRDEG
ncbi:MAG: aminotransferase class V-fold PLP-dependent enzyme [Phycisphaerales bacterium]|nr:aminotransferase class V-fold PLP-dependent enzyme [Phycisphaerales bacterium]